MKVSCKIIEDILPMYYDCVCSEESATLVEEHLKECPGCSQFLADLHDEIDISNKPIDDMKPLEGIRIKWKSEKSKYIQRGIFIALVALLFITGVLCAIWYFSYGKYWYQLTDNMEKANNMDNPISSSDYTLEKDGYRFDISLPIVLSNSGFVRIMDKNGLVMFLYPETYGTYSFWLYITDQNSQSYSVYLKSNMMPDFENHPFPVRTEAEKAHITQLLIEQEEAINSMLDAVRELWGVELMQYTP